MKIRTWPILDGGSSQREASRFNHVKIQELLHYTRSVAASVYQRGDGMLARHYKHLHIQY
jgi:hypothetical protein